MYKISKTLSLILVVFFTNSVLNAQSVQQQNTTAGKSEKTSRVSAEKKAQLLTDTINSVVRLSADQYSSIYQVNLTYLTKRALIKNDKTEGASMEMIKAQQQSIAWDRKSQIASLLTLEQLERWKKWKSDRKKAKSIEVQKMKESGSLPNVKPTNGESGSDDIDGM